MTRRVRNLTKGETVALELLKRWLESDLSQEIPKEIRSRARVLFQDTPIANFRIEDEAE
jgi:hypothetical protein